MDIVMTDMETDLETKTEAEAETDTEGGYFSEESSTFGDRVAAGRRALGIDQEKLSRKLGIKLKTLRAWEEDISEPRANKLQMLAGVLNISIIWLLTGEGEGANDPWEAEESSSLDSCVAEVGKILTELRVARHAHKAFGDRLARLEKRLSKLQKKIV